MSKIALTVILCGVLASAAAAHEQHHMECTETALQALLVDIQAMNDGAAKTTAMKEVELAEAMLGKKDTDACMTHMHKAMEEIEK